MQRRQDGMDSMRTPVNPELFQSLAQATRLLLQKLTLSLNFLWLPQELMASLGGIGRA